MKPGFAISVALARNASLAQAIDYGLDWRRKKWPTIAKAFIKWAERISRYTTNSVVTDSRVVAQFLARQSHANRIQHGQHCGKHARQSGSAQSLANLSHGGRT